ncbi:MAG: hypothetical protein AWU59_2214 [Methanolobus sp. T82-4]|jgi:hypothetical protein|nr:MAG: hypothetical protein AWU59_2214 [Methanolobus sp. T82-4]
MSIVKNAPRTSTTIVIRSDANARITHSRDPYYNLMRRLFQEEETAVRGQKFLIMVEERQKSGDPIKTNEWQKLLEELDIGRASFYSMRNKLLGAGLISNRNGEYRLSGQFSKDLIDMARWWWTAVLDEGPESL